MTVRADNWREDLRYDPYDDLESAGSSTFDDWLSESIDVMPLPPPKRVARPPPRWVVAVLVTVAVCLILSIVSALVLTLAGVATAAGGSSGPSAKPVGSLISAPVVPSSAAAVPAAPAAVPLPKPEGSEAGGSEGQKTATNFLAQ